MQPRIARSVITILAVTLLAVGLIPGPALGDDSPRISQLELEIQRLRTRIDEQHRRILRLEEELRRRSGPGIPALPAPNRAADAGDIPQATEPLPWHTAQSWARVSNGMTEDEVKEILGPPTSTEAVGSYKTMYYRGPAAGAGSLSGIVNFRDDRVVAVNAPDFP